MAVHVLMPALSPTMTEGTLTKWCKKAGDKVQPGDVIAEVETDKATMEIEAVDAGTLGELLVEEGTGSVKVNQPIATLLQAGDAPSKVPHTKVVEQNTPPSVPVALTVNGARSQSSVRQASAPQRGAASQTKRAPSDGPSAEVRILISPLARRLAQQSGLDVARVRGSGPAGRIIKADVLMAVASTRNSMPPAAGPASFTTTKPDTMRRVIAARMGEAKRTIPHFYLTIDCEIDAILELRRGLNEITDVTHNVSLTDLIIRASALALRKVPEANACWKDDQILTWNSVDVAVAVAMDNGLITPIVRQADEKGVIQISTEMKKLAADARAGRLKPEDFQGGTFSISNLGMYGVRQFEAIINPPQAAILAIGASERRAVVKKETVVIATMMSCTLSADHRVIDGAVGAKLLSEFKKIVEQPFAIMV